MSKARLLARKSKMAKQKANNSLMELLGDNESIVSNQDDIIKIETDLCSDWEFNDRSNFDYGNIQELAERIKTQGQIVPAIVRKKKNGTYEVISGSRRLEAAKIAKAPLIAIVKNNLSNKEALSIQYEENRNREGISDYSDYLLFNKLLTKKVLKSQKQIADMLNVSTSYISNLMSFGNISKILRQKIGNFSRVSSRTATVLVAFESKGAKYKKVLLDYADEIKNGAGEKRIKSFVEQALKENKQAKLDFQEIQSSNGHSLMHFKIKDSSIQINLSAEAKKNLKLTEFDFDEHIMEFARAIEEALAIMSTRVDNN
ncbi:Nucleoid occlusion protein (plasmid) [Piscirickettsia salmonis]|uniref:ParB/RepB/Spo0J family partition protein n=1 Tax=Piscirickettsia salmonis TaxID=1238 RepID=UPI0012BAE6E5|nr:ParB/RepB/Spo0J family partition protein [Piscirickettsia salmonis]QGP56768.1 Nucleoid occlusion protein [Piscirickettsia salmonis]QGP61489.1 Nucleoid occlusion protein [Piscirickettsia salmonis]QGP66333.1 Nucleoid occlusion protein [Piscirickettsia salmonis]